ncbi:MAG TPA: hypothetical protein VN496_10390 [Burkholderiales bacterium]|nr:hypothetical protein [Burkholderiales bacterium]
MKPKQAPKTTTASVASRDKAHKKAYQQPALRALGALHLLTRSGVSSMNGDGGALMMP